jgi:membrane fusion protein, multidrug efflux system
VNHSRVAPALLGGLVLVTSASCNRSGGAASSPPSRPALAVRTAPVAVQDVVYRIKALGSLEAEDLVRVTAEVEGAVAEVLFNEGNAVTPQTTLLRIDPERYRLELERAEAALREATAEAERAGADLVRREELAGARLVAPEELARSRQETARLLAAVEASRVARAIAEQNVRRSEVHPPTSGVINTRTVDTGQFVKTGDLLATLVDAGRLRLRFKVSDAESLYARVGAEVTFRVSALGARDFPARIYHVGQVADPTTRQVEVLAWVANPGELKPGFFAEVALAGESRQAALVVPEAAVQASEVGFVTYVVEDGVARQRPITIGLRTGDGLVEIVDGLKPGQVVVIEGSDRLADGTPVRDASAPPDAPPADK